MDDRPEGNSVDAWLERFAAQLPAGSDTTLGPDDREALLDLARVAAHQSERIAAPLTTYLLGLAFAGSPLSGRTARIREITARLTG